MHWLDEKYRIKDSPIVAILHRKKTRHASGSSRGYSARNNPVSKPWKPICAEVDEVNQLLARDAQKNGGVFAAILLP